MANKNFNHVFRLLPGADLRLSIEDFVIANNIEAGWIACAIGSLTIYSIRFANQSEAANGNGYFEILNCSGTVSLHGSHLHVSIADSEGKTIGGHLMKGCKIYTTAEIVIVEAADYVFTRMKDVHTQFNELHIEQKGF
ncbi:MAG: PPC domain-containing DNA-binding protein [Ginsengibacter sp.]